MFPKLALRSGYSVTVACVNAIAVFSAGNGSAVLLNKVCEDNDDLALCFMF